MANTANVSHEEQQYETIIGLIKHWPTSDRLHLAQAILRTLEPEVSSQRKGKVPARDAEGILAGSWPAPSDTEVEILIDEYLSEKYQ